MNDLMNEDLQRIKLIAITFHASHIKPADRMMGAKEKMPWDFKFYTPPEKWRFEYDPH